jgi:hypothetical protein
LGVFPGYTGSNFIEQHRLAIHLRI